MNVFDAVLLGASISIGLAWWWFPKLRNLTTDDPILRKQNEEAWRRVSEVQHELNESERKHRANLEDAIREGIQAEKQRYVEYLSKTADKQFPTIEDQLNDLHMMGNVHE